MIPYTGSGRKQPGVTAYEFNADSITVEFRSGERYVYTYSSAGASTIEAMKNIALANEGLSTFIAQQKPPYERKL